MTGTSGSLRVRNFPPSARFPAGNEARTENDARNRNEAQRDEAFDVARSRFLFPRPRMNVPRMFQGRLRHDRASNPRRLGGGAREKKGTTLLQRKAPRPEGGDGGGSACLPVGRYPFPFAGEEKERTRTFSLSRRVVSGQSWRGSEHTSPSWISG